MFAICFHQLNKFASNKQLLLNGSLTAMAHSVNERRWVNHYTGPESSIKEICEQFSKYQGGKVELHQDSDTGIATIKLNHPERRNALSGNNNNM